MSETEPPQATTCLSTVVPQFLLAWVAGLAEQSCDQALAEIGLKPLHLGVLSLLLDGGAAMQASLSERLDVFKPVMVTLINEIEAMARSPTNDI